MYADFVEGEAGGGEDFAVRLMGRGAGSERGKGARQENEVWE